MMSVSEWSRDVQRRMARRMLSGHTAAVVAKLRDLAPYAAMELVLPGGSLMALLLWLYRRHRKTVKKPARSYNPESLYRIIIGQSSVAPLPEPRAVAVENCAAHYRPDTSQASRQI
jgi:hypothetical protein